jgi:MerR family transcriptional regulator, thiopeptide resistance regulator
VQYTIGEVAALAHVTVRTLHHYDALGLLCPSARSASGYRLYDDVDLARLQQILTYRRLELPLARIREIMSDPDWDEVAGLREQRALLLERAGHLRALIAAIDRALEARTMDIPLTPQERFEVFGDFDPDEHAEEARERWGKTDAYKESARRVQRYGKDEWLQIKAEGEEAVRSLVAAMATGAAPDDPRAMDAIDRHRRHIDRWFYPCPAQMHRHMIAA